MINRGVARCGVSSPSLVRAERPALVPIRRGPLFLVRVVKSDARRGMPNFGLALACECAGQQNPNPAAEYQRAAARLDSDRTN
jgi:hypothetical protein